MYQGAFRVRALYQQSSEFASKNRDSYYRVKVNDDNAGVSSGSWWLGDSGNGFVFRHRVFEDVDSFADINLRRYPSGLSFGEADTAIGDSLFGMYRNLTVCMLVQTSKGTNIGGWAIQMARPSPNEQHTVRLAVGADTNHEFSHAFGFLSDEYIEGRESQPKPNRSNPTEENILNLSNLSYSAKYSEVPWLHLSPWGRDKRQAAGNEPSPLLGWAWVGGVKHRYVWHSEYQCLMNGQHDNFQYTQVTANDPTAKPDGTYDDDSNSGKNLRDKVRFCLWCQELVVMRILERTDQLQESGDPVNFVDKGKRWYVRWKNEFRKNYWELFDVPQQIKKNESDYASMNVGPAGEALETSDLYAPFSEDTPSRSGSSNFDEGAWLALLG